MGYVTCRLRFFFDARSSLTVCSATLTSTSLPLWSTCLPRHDDDARAPPPLSARCATAQGRAFQARHDAHESYGRCVGDGQACGSSTPVALRCAREHGQRRHCRNESTRRRATTSSDSRSPEVTSDDQARVGIVFGGMEARTRVPRAQFKANSTQHASFRTVF